MKVCCLECLGQTETGVSPSSPVSGVCPTRQIADAIDFRAVDRRIGRGPWSRSFPLNVGAPWVFVALPIFRFRRRSPCLGLRKIPVSSGGQSSVGRAQPADGRRRYTGAGALKSGGAPEGVSQAGRHRMSPAAADASAAPEPLFSMASGCQAAMIRRVRCECRSRLSRRRVTWTDFKSYLEALMTMGCRLSSRDEWRCLTSVFRLLGLLQARTCVDHAILSFLLIIQLMTRDPEPSRPNRTQSARFGTEISC